MPLWGKTDANADKPKNWTPSMTGGQLIYVDEVEASIQANKDRGLKGPGWWEYLSYTDASGNTRHKAIHLINLVDTTTIETQDDDAIAADFASTITISAQPANQSTFVPLGAILTFTEGAGTTLAGEVDETYTAVSVDIGDATFTVTRDANGDIDTVTLVDAGSGYDAADIITIDGADIGGVTVTDDLVITVDTVATAAATFSVTAGAAPSGTLVYQWQVQGVTATRWTNISGATSASLALTSLTTADTGKKYRVKITSSAGAPEVISNTATLTVTAA
jgi:hypothetical protein